MLAFGMPRLDPGAEGIHLLWAPPDLLPLSEGGYDIQRREVSNQRQPRCETIEQPILDTLVARGEYPALLGPLRFRRGVTLAPVISSVETQGASGVSAFIQELTTPTNGVTVRALTGAGSAVVVALFEGKAVAAETGSRVLDSASFSLRAPAIDTVILYATSVAKILEICVFDLPDAQSSETQWHDAPYIVKGLTLPMNGVDPVLTTFDSELAAARSRLVASETLGQQDFLKMTHALWSAHSNPGRSGERVALMRAVAGEALEELTLGGVLSALSIHPKLRRVLGFAYADRKGLTPGQTYAYRVTGRFHAEDLYDDIYDVHLAPSSTPLPAAFVIRGLGVRLQKPAKVVLDPPVEEDVSSGHSRRGIRIDASGFDSTWLAPSFGQWSAVFDLPRPVKDVILEVAENHSFAYAAGNMEAFQSPAAKPLPVGPSAALHFDAPITQLRLAGTGTLFVLRLPSGQSGIVELHAETAPIQFAAQPLPAPPISLTVTNQQQPPTPLIGAIDDSTKLPLRPPVGFKLSWLPAVAGGLTVWPDDLDAGPPLEPIAYQIQHRRTDIASPWENIVGGDNLVVGSRDVNEPVVRLQEGMDFDEVYPRVRRRASGAGFTLHLSDVFGQNDPTTGAVRPAQPLGTVHQYQIRAVDAVGRVSASWTLSNTVRLEKHVPPPLPVGPQPSPEIDATNHLTAPPGPSARVIVAGAKGLTAADQQTLGNHANAIVLAWGWRQHERNLDPTTAEFRVYVSKPLDVVSGTVTAVEKVEFGWEPPFTLFGWQLSITCDADVKALAAGECAGQWVTCGGYPFLISSHTEGTSFRLIVERSRLQEQAIPVTGPVVFGRPLRPDHQRSAGWGRRVAVVSLTAKDSYTYVFYDLLALRPEHPSDALWVGVSAADAESYIADELASGPNALRPGNESSIAACAVTARYQGQPVFSLPPPVGQVPELVTEEPTGRQVLVSLDLVALLGGALPPGSPIALERCSSDDVLSRVSVDPGGRVLLVDSGVTPPVLQVIAFPNPADQAAVVATLRSDPRRLANRYQIYLVAQAARPESFFSRVSGQTLPVAVIEDRLPPKPGRFFYRVRAADALGHVSEGSAILPLAVRVPSTAPAAVPLRRSLTAKGGSRVNLTIGVPADPDTTHVLLFEVFTPAGTAPVNQAAAELLRLPNRSDLYRQGGGLRLHLADGSLLAPSTVKALTGGGVTIGESGERLVTLGAGEHAADGWVTLWCFGLTRDGFPSSACGPFSSGVKGVS
ncbi:MAG TPA: hypothetical protein VH988_33750 [Thermoanaerobaculia bacterium]|jgi:hypothetical protein|nr:hypothetical protein [Thermoanaerobaculia bacterium]